MDEVFSGVIAEEVLGFTSFPESRKIAGVSRAWRKACRSSLVWKSVDVVGYNANALALLADLPDRTRGFRVDVEAGETGEVLAACLARNLNSIEIYARRRDGAVMLPLGDLISRFSQLPLNNGLHILIQEPGDSEICETLTRFGNRIKTLIFLRGLDNVDSDTLSQLIGSLTVIEELRLGACSIEFDFVVDKVIALSSTLKRFQAEALNISLGDLSRIVRCLDKTICDIGGMHVLALFGGLI